MISLTERHFGVMTLEVSVDRAAEIRIASRIVARQGGIEEDRHSREREGAGDSSPTGISRAKGVCSKESAFTVPRG